MPIALLLQLAGAIPTLAKYLGAPDAAQVVANKVGEIAQAVTGAASPEEAVKQLFAEKELMAKMQIAVMENEYKLDAMYIADVQNARDRDVKLAQAGFKNTRANWLAAMALSLVIVCLCIVVWMSTIDEFAKGAITLILGRALGWVEQIFQFEFGTTRSSKQKDDTITKLSGDKS